MEQISVIFPHQLFEDQPLTNACNNVIIVENDLIFKHFDFHVAKLVLHRMSMMRYAEKLINQGLKVRYIDNQSPLANASLLFRELSNTYSKIHVIEPEDDWLSKHIKSGISGSTCDLIIHANPNFITPIGLGYDYFEDKKRYFQTDFYAFQRKRLGILLNSEGKPLGGKLTFDSDNRKSYPKNHQFPDVHFAPISNDFHEAKSYVLANFPKAKGNLNYFENRNQFYPSTTEEAKLALEQFLQHRFSLFGDLEDAFGQNPVEHFLYHSVLTPALNIGLINPDYIVNRALEYAQSHQIPMNSLEGFIRQIIGWREFMRIIYHREGRKQRTSNFWNFQRQIPPSFYNGTTGIDPIDVVIKKVLETGYAHHIERLMVIGNFFLLCEFHPNQVYQWFMELFVDAYDWVMVPNIYGMSQFADGGLITTKPYFSGSNYIIKMSDYRKQKDSWQEIWDGLFWRFISTHRQFLQQNPRLGMMVISFDKMSSEKQMQHLKRANDFLTLLDKS